MGRPIGMKKQGQRHEQNNEHDFFTPRKGSNGYHDDA
jgi:hypothetical protein